MVDEFMECPTCEAKPGIPTLCKSCLKNRKTIEKLKTLIMRYEQILKRDDGVRIKITVTVHIGRNKPVYDYNVERCEKGKRKFKSVVDTDDWTYRSLPQGLRQNFEKVENYKHVTAAEVNQAHIECWGKLKPVK
jgi:hypothetical protein